MGKYFRAVLLTVLHEVNFGLQKLATFFQSEQCYAVLKQLFIPTVIYKLKMISNDLLLPLNHLKNLKEPEWKKYGRPLPNCWKDVEWMDIGAKSKKVLIGIPRRKIYPLICCNTYFVIIKCCYGNINRQTCIHTTCPSITKSAIEAIPIKRNAEIRSKPSTKIWNLLCLESGICTGKIRILAPGIWNPQRGIKNLILSWITLQGAN